MEQGRRDPDYIADPDIAQYLNTMGRRLTSNAPGGAPDIEVFGVRDAAINAFAMPGGFIGINTGLIVSAGAESEVAGVLAHEIAHVTQRHIARGLTQQSQSAHLAIATIAATVLAALMPGTAGIAGGVMAFGQAAMIERQLGFSRDAEQEADRTGFEMLSKSGYDPNGMAQMFGRLMNAASLNEGVGGGGAYVSTHPLSIQRMTDMQNRARQLPPGQYRNSDEFWYVRAKSRLVQATDPKATRQAVDLMQEETRASGQNAAEAVKRSAAWYGLSIAALQRNDLKEAARTLKLAETGVPPSPYLDLQRVEIELAGSNKAAALAGAQAGLKRWPDRRAFGLKVVQSLQVMRKDREAVVFLQEQIKRWGAIEPSLYQLLATSQDRLGEPVAARQSMASYYVLSGALPAAVTQLQQARTLSQDFYLQSQIDVEIRAIRNKIAEDRRLLERFRS